MLVETLNEQEGGTGRVLNTEGTPLPNTEVDVWQCNEKGFYSLNATGGTRTVPRTFTSSRTHRGMSR